MTLNDCSINIIGRMFAHNLERILPELRTFPVSWVTALAYTACNDGLDSFDLGISLVLAAIYAINTP